jgi:hypothetical protein
MNKLILLIACMLVSVCAFAAQPQPAPKFLSLSDMEKVIVPVQPTQNEVADMNAPTSDADCGCNKITIKPDDVTITLCIQEGKNIKCAEVVFESAFTVDIVIVVNSK